MNPWTIEDVARATRGHLVQKGTRPLSGVSKDSREDLKNKIFFALKGENFDGHEFVGGAAEKGAGLVVVDRDIPSVTKECSVIRVENTLKALQDFAVFHRKNWLGTLVAITGSNGKTTTKEFAATLLGQKYTVLSTRGNLNNHVGVPLTLLELRPQHKMAVVEMGMNHYGEIAALCAIAQPNVVLVTNVGRAHIEFFGSLENIARAKEEIYEAAPETATRVYNLDNPHTAMMRARAPGQGRVLTYSSYDRDVDVTLKEKLLTLDYVEVMGRIGDEPGVARIPCFGRQQVYNAMAASTLALACGLEAALIWKGLQLCQAIWGRNQVIDLTSGAKVLFDAYNANPDSVTAAIDNFSKISCRGRKFVVLGEMLELGEQSGALHREVGQRLGKCSDIERVWLIGPHAADMEAGMQLAGFRKSIVVSESYEEKLAASFGDVLETGDIVLIKGSRGMSLERVVEGWRPLNFGKKH